MGQNNPQFPSGKAEEADEAYAYDAVGNRRAVLDGQGDTLSVLSYNLLNLPKEYRLADGAKERYVYSADGEKLYVQHVTASNVTTGTEYAANYRFENGSIAMIHTDAGYYTPVPPPSGSGSPTYMHVWYLKDHLGNNRVLADGTGTALRKHHYDPFGEAITLSGAAASPFPTGATESPYKYGGKEWDSTTSTYDFEARQFSPNFHRFTTMDPLCEKYYGISPYAYCANNPVKLIDPTGNVFTDAAWVYINRLINDINRQQAQFASQIAKKQSQIDFGGQRSYRLPSDYDDLQNGPADATQLAPIIQGNPGELQKLANRTHSAFRINGITYRKQGR